MKSAKAWIIAVAVICVVGIGFRHYLFPTASETVTANGEDASETEEGATPEVSKQLTGVQIAEKSLDFLKSMTDLDSYYPALQCDKNLPGGCQKVDTLDGSPYLHPWIAEAYNAVFAATGNKAYRDIAVLESTRTLNEFIGLGSNYAPPPGCPFAWGVLEASVREYNATKNEKYLKVMQICEKELLRGNFGVTGANRPKFKGKELPQDEISSLLLTAHVGVISYEFSHHEPVKDIAEKYLRRAVEAVEKPSLFNSMIYRSSGTSMMSQSCLVQRAVLDLYSITKTSGYLKESEAFFNKVKIGSNVRKFITSKSLIDCADALQKYSEISQQPAYREEAAAALQELALNYWDYPDVPKVNGDGGLLLMRGRGEKQTEDVARGIMVFAGFPDKNFSVARSP